MRFFLSHFGLINLKNVDSGLVFSRLANALVDQRSATKVVERIAANYSVANIIAHWSLGNCIFNFSRDTGIVDNITSDSFCPFGAHSSCGTNNKLDNAYNINNSNDDNKNNNSEETQSGIRGVGLRGQSYRVAKQSLLSLYASSICYDGYGTGANDKRRLPW